MCDTSNLPLHEITHTSRQPLPGTSDDYTNLRIPLFHASVIGDLEEMEKILEYNVELKDELLGYGITEEKSTALHVAVFSQNLKLVQYLVSRMTEEQLALQDKYGRTALIYVTGVGNVNMAKAMVNKCPRLLKIRVGKWLPIRNAAVFGKRSIVDYLYRNYKRMASNDWTSEDIHEVFYKCIEADLFDCALKIFDDNNTKEFPEMECAREVLYILARKTYAFKDKKSWKNSITWMRPTRESSTVAQQLVRKIWKNILGRPTNVINAILKGRMVIIKDKETYPFQISFVAAEMGNTNFLIELTREYPELLWRKNDNRQNIFHIAVTYRHESIYNLIYEMGSLHNIMTRIKDKDSNNMLHLVGMKAKNPHEDVLGVVFQMQRELLWFKEVNSKVPTYCKDEKNRDGLTPLQLFTENHQGMVSEGEKWMKDTANQCMVVAALVTTVVFAAAFTIPGGYVQDNGHQDNGLPVFLKAGPFRTFVILDAISLILSSASIIMFLSILTSRYGQDDFLVALPKKLMIGLTTLFLSIITMMVAFSVSFFVLYHKKLISIPIIISVGAVVPIYLYMKLQFPLLVDAYHSTYARRYLFRPKKRVLFYRNPRF